MTDRIKRVYVPMTETGFYILYCLQDEMHGYNIGQKVKQMTGGEVTTPEPCMEHCLRWRRTD